MIKRIDHIVITTGDLNQCIAFYERLGFTPRLDENKYALIAGEFQINIHIRGREGFPRAGNVQIGSTDMCFEIEGDLETIRETLEKQQLMVEFGIVERCGVKGPMRALYLRDPDGNLVELCQYNQSA